MVVTGTCNDPAYKPLPYYYTRGISGGGGNRGNRKLRCRSLPFHGKDEDKDPLDGGGEYTHCIFLDETKVINYFQGKNVHNDFSPPKPVSNLKKLKF